MRWEVFNVGRATEWAFADGVGVNPKADPETIGLAILINDKIIWILELYIILFNVYNMYI